MRVRLTWERLRSLTAKRSRARELNPASMSIQLQGDPAQVPPVAFGADLVARSVTHSTGRATLGYSPSIPFAQYRKGLPHLTDEEVVTLLSQSPRTSWPASIGGSTNGGRRDGACWAGSLSSHV